MSIAQSVRDSHLFPVLDICCGTGKQCSLISNGKQLVLGVDIDNKMLKYAHSKYKGISLICADASKAPLRDSSFKGIIISYALHEQSDSFRWQVIRESSRLLSSDGKLIILDFDSIWKKRSIIVYILIYLIERIAGKNHFLNGRDFAKQGGLSSFIRKTNLKEVKKVRRAKGNSSLIYLKKKESFH